MNEEFPFADHSFDNNGFSQHYVDEGSGHPVVMVHGNPSWSFLYRNLIKELVASGYRAIAPDHIGCGRSEKPGDDRYPYTLERRVADFDRFINHLNLPKFTLVVHDWGGMIGLTWALDHLEKIASLVIMNTSAFPLPKGMPFPRTVALARSPLLGTLLVRGANAFVKGAIKRCAMKPLAPAIAAGFAAPYNNWDNRVAVKHFVDDIPLFPTDTSWAIVERTSNNMEHIMDVPAILLWGEHDFVFDHHFLAEWRRRLPELPVHTFPEAGHYLLEDAFDQIWPLIKNQIEPFKV